MLERVGRLAYKLDLPTRSKTIRANKPDAKTIIEGVEKLVAAIAKLMTNEHDARHERGLDCRPT